MSEPSYGVGPSWKDSSLPDDLRLLRRQHRIPLGWKVGAWLFLCMGIVGRVDMEVEKTAEQARVDAPYREPLALSHPLNCPGVWTKSCADFETCKTTCNVEENRK